MSGARVFISYSHEDLAAALAVEKALQGRDVSVWRDQENIYAGQQWPKVIGEAVSSNDAIVLLWSESSSISHFVEFEWTTAIALKKMVIPFLLDDTPLVPSLASFNGIRLNNLEKTVESVIVTISRASMAADPERTSAVLKKLQQVAPGESSSMARTASRLLTRDLPPDARLSNPDKEGLTAGNGLEGLELGRRGESL